MTQTGIEDAEPSAQDIEDWHHLLLRVAGSLPDEVLTDARDFLAAGAPEETAALIGMAAVAGQVPLWEMDALLVAGELERGGYETGPLDDLVLAEFAETRPSAWVFSPKPEDDGSWILDELELEDRDPIDQAAVRAARDEPRVTGLWRSWRLAASSLSVPGPTRVYLVAVTDENTIEDVSHEASGDAGDQLTDQGPAATTGRIQSALKAAGERAPQVEVCPPGIIRPDYQESAWARSALLFTREPVPDISLARVFDTVDPQTGPAFDADHPRLTDEAEIERLLDYLESAPVVLESVEAMDDVLDPERTQAVSLSLRSDGEWIWTDTVAYYLAEHGLAPEPELLAHLRNAAEPQGISEVTRHRVLSLLLRPGAGEPVWTVPAEMADEQPG